VAHNPLTKNLNFCRIAALNSHIFSAGAIIYIIKTIIFAKVRLYVRKPSLTSTSVFHFLLTQKTVNCKTHRQRNSLKLKFPDNGKIMNYKSKLTSSNSGHSRGNGSPSDTKQEPWSTTLANITTGENRGAFKGKIVSSLIYISGFSQNMLEDLPSWEADLLDFLSALTEHATGVSPDMEQLTELLSLDHSPAIDVQHQDSLGIYIPLSTAVNFSYTGPTSSSIDADFDEAPIITIFPDHFLVDFPRFRSRERFLSQAIDLPSLGHLIQSGDIGAVRGLPIDSYGGSLTASMLNLLLQYFQGATSSSTWIQLKLVQYRYKTVELYGIIKSHAALPQRTLDRKQLNLTLSEPQLFHMAPLVVLLAPDLAAARAGTSILRLPAEIKALRIPNWPRGQDVRDMLSALAQDSTPLAMEAIRMAWVHRDVMTLRPTATASKGDTLYLYVPEGQRPADLFAGEAVNTDNKGIRRQLHGPDAIPAFRQLQALLALQLPPPSTPPAPAKPVGMRGKSSTLTRSGTTNRSASVVKPPLTVAAAGGFTVVSRRTPKAPVTVKPKPWEQQPLKLSALLGVPVPRGHAPLQFAPAAPTPHKVGRPVSTLNDQEYPPLAGTASTPVYWKLLEQPARELDCIVHPVDDDPDDLPQGVLGRMAHLGIRDPLSALMAYKAARSQVALLPLLYPEWPTLSSPISIDFFTDSPLLAPKLTGTQKLVQITGPPATLEAACEVWGVSTPAQYKAVLIVLQVQYLALHLHWSQQSVLPTVVSGTSTGYLPFVFRLSAPEFMSLAVRHLPILPQTPLPAADQDFNDAVTAPRNVGHALRALALMSVAEATHAGFPPSFSVLVGDFHLDPRLPWDLFLSGVPDHTHWTVPPPVRQLLMEFRAYSSTSQSHLVRALSVLETAMDWSRAREHLEVRGNHRTAHLPRTVVPLKPSTSSMDTVDTDVITGLADMCNQALVDPTSVSDSIQEYPLQWSGLYLLLESWSRNPVYLPWGVWNQEDLFAIMQEASLDEVAPELYLSFRSSGPAWVKLLTPHWVKHPTRSPTVYSPDPTVLQINKLTHTLGTISSDLASFLVITMAQRAPYWRRAITVIGAYKLTIASDLDIPPRPPTMVAHTLWSLGAHGYREINSLLRVILQHTDELRTLIAILNDDQLEYLAPDLTEEALLGNGSLPPGEYYKYSPPDPTHLIWAPRDASDTVMSDHE